jgi:hypothetical protein
VADANNSPPHAGNGNGNGNSKAAPYPVPSTSTRPAGDWEPARQQAARGTGHIMMHMGGAWGMGPAWGHGPIHRAFTHTPHTNTNTKTGARDAVGRRGLCGGCAGAGASASAARRHAVWHMTHGLSCRGMGHHGIMWRWRCDMCYCVLCVLCGVWCLYGVMCDIYGLQVTGLGAASSLSMPLA